MSENLTTSPDSRLGVDFSWGKLSYLIYDMSTEKKKKKKEPVVLVKHNCLFKPHLRFLDAETKATIGTSSVHNFSIHADCTIVGSSSSPSSSTTSLRLKAQKRWSTKYSYLSHAYSDTEHPVVMTWTSSSGLKNWDFVLLDDKGEAVARYSTNLWAVKKVGEIEFVGPKRGRREVRDEVLVTVCTIYYCVTEVRAMNVFSLFNSALADVSPVKAVEEGDKSA